MFCGAGILTVDILCRSHAGSICRIRQDVYQLIVESREDMAHISGDISGF